MRCIRSFLYGQSDLIFAAAAVDGDAPAKDKVGNRSDAGCGRSGCLQLHALTLSGVKSDRASLCTNEPVAYCDVGEHIDIGDILRTKEVGVGDSHRERMLRAALACGKN